MSTYNENEYLRSVYNVLANGREKTDRTGVGTRSLAGVQTRYRLSAGFPLLTTKKMQWHSIVGELLWMLSGSTNAHELRDKYGSKIWLEWADEDGSLGPIYGKQWRRFNESLWATPDRGPATEPCDQIADLLRSLKTNPLSRRHVVTTWNPAEIPDMALPPCHGIATQFVCEPLDLAERCDASGWCASTVNNELDAASAEGFLNAIGAPHYRLSCVMHQRSGDMFLGVPFNIASYSLLTHMISAELNMVPGDFVHTIGDAHIYRNHVDQFREQLNRIPCEAPTLALNPSDGSRFSVLDAKPEDIVLEDYQHHPAIPALVAV